MFKLRSSIEARFSTLAKRQSIKSCPYELFKDLPNGDRCRAGITGGFAFSIRHDASPSQLPR